jgi:hypothetical protein
MSGHVYLQLFVKLVVFLAALGGSRKSLPVCLLLLAVPTCLLSLAAFACL